MFSIVIPLYNKEKYVAQTLQSVLKQTFQKFEIIIVDDGSTDKSVTEVEKFDDSRIHIIRQVNSGVSAARNKGIEKANYDLVAFLDADDEWLPNYLFSQYELVKKFPTCHVFAMAYDVYQYGTKKIPYVAPLPFEKAGIVDYFCIAYKSDPFIWSSAVIVKKDALKSIGGFPVGITSGEDLLVWAKLAIQNKIVYSKEVRSIYYIRENSWEAGRAPDNDDFVGNELKNLLAHDKDNICLKRYISYWHKIRASMYIKHESNFKAFKESMQSLFYNPYNLKNYQSLVLSLMPYHLVKLLYIYKERKI